MSTFTRILYFGNVFYGLCTVALSIETNLQLGITLNRPPFYLLIFLATVVYYSRIYYNTSFHFTGDERSAWFAKHRALIRRILLTFSLAIAGVIVYIAAKNYPALLTLSPTLWLLLFLVPIAGLLYTIPIFSFRKLRHVGWLKPFVIGFVWVGIVTLFPVLFWQVRNPGQPAGSLLPALIFWFQNLLFISSLAVVFDIKDHTTDKAHGLITIPAKLGVHNTVTLVVVPLAALSFIVLYVFLQLQGRSFIVVGIQLIPYILLLLCLRNISERKNLLFYLAAIDGLMFLKGVCGILSITFL
ncbi:UbiA family prenyltransferase [Segetibacter sp. 3557_3]|uniref:UbiA family prenyltransferase n=1 Tax=Segetibacter sp. 3557_3 TaxID=2547429 RepID=UPI0014042721|nr:UbiA family prenyltransferase [Segetibacter sp. 3557_3]